VSYSAVRQPLGCRPNHIEPPFAPRTRLYMPTTATLAGKLPSEWGLSMGKDAASRSKRRLTA